MQLERVIGANVRRARSDAGLSQAALGRALAAYLGTEWPRQAVSAAETGARAFKASELVALALALDVAPQAFLMPVSAGEAVELPSGATISAIDLIVRDVPSGGALAVRAKTLKATSKRARKCLGELLDIADEIEQESALLASLAKLSPKGGRSQ